MIQKNKIGLNPKNFSLFLCWVLYYSYDQMGKLIKKRSLWEKFFIFFLLWFWGGWGKNLPSRTFLENSRKEKKIFFFPFDYLGRNAYRIEKI
ncbi:MAG: hypothetical protein CM15mP106_7890 [Candidatus Neomarinimicrobiota bacterium]|nr:MAG: hypothetical protein CM15mP106_7890 [Candidatus Neomarinimicrobiota bacterium]